MRATLIIGAGPGGTGPLVWAAQNGVLAPWLSSGVTMVDDGPDMGGTLGRYIINSDSLGGVYLECLRSPHTRELFEPLAADASAHELERLKQDFPPLSLVDRYLHRLGGLLTDIVTRHPGGEFLTHTRVRALHYRADGTLAAEIASPRGQVAHLEARTVVLALGGRSRWTSGRVEIAPGVNLADFPAEKIMPTNTLMTANGRRRAVALIQRAASRRVVILGGAHSAFSAAWLLTHLMPELTFGNGDISIVSRRIAPIYYETLAAAEADGYPATLADVCPKTQRVHRLGGVRGDGREMWRRITRRRGCVPEERVVLVSLDELAQSPAALRRLLDEAALIIPAFGYRARTLPVYDANGRRLRLNA